MHSLMHRDVCYLPGTYQMTFKLIYQIARIKETHVGTYIGCLTVVVDEGERKDLYLVLFTVNSTYIYLLHTYLCRCAMMIW